MDNNKKEKKNREEEVKKAKEEIEKIIKDAEEQLGVDKKSIRVIKVRLPEPTFKYIATEAIITLLLNIVLVMAISGYFKWAKYSSLSDLLYFAIIFSLIDIVLRNIINFVYPSLIIKSFGLINLVPPLLSMFIVVVFTEFVAITSNINLFILFICLMILRVFIRNSINNFRR